MPPSSDFFKNEHPEAIFRLQKKHAYNRFLFRKEKMGLNEIRGYINI